MSASYEVQKAIYGALIADAAVGALVGDRIYDQMPTDGAYPCVTFGPSDEVTDDADCIDGETHTLQIDVWSRDQGRVNPCKVIVSAVKAALHEAAITLPDPYAMVEIRVPSTRTFRDADGVTAHGVLTVAAMVEL